MSAVRCSVFLADELAQGKVAYTQSFATDVKHLNHQLRHIDAVVVWPRMRGYLKTG